MSTKVFETMAEMCEYLYTHDWGLNDICIDCCYESRRCLKHDPYTRWERFVRWCRRV